MFVKIGSKRYFWRVISELVHHPRTCLNVHTSYFEGIRLILRCDVPIASSKAAVFGIRIENKVLVGRRNAY